MVMIENPKPTKIFRIVDSGTRTTTRWSSLGWRGPAAQRYPIIFLGCYLALRQGGDHWPSLPSSACRVPLLRLPPMRSATKG